MVRLNHSLSERGWKFISSWIGKQPLYNLPNHKNGTTTKKTSINYSFYVWERDGKVSVLQNDFFNRGS